MIRFTDLITGDFESEADREVAPFIMFLGLPVIAPCMIGYWGFKGAQAFYYHNPIRMMANRRKSIKMMDNGVNPIFFNAPSKEKSDFDDFDVDEYYTEKEQKEYIKECDRIVKKIVNYKPYLDKNYSSVKVNKVREEVIQPALYKPKKLVLKK